MSRNLTRWLAGFFRGSRGPAFLQPPVLLPKSQKRSGSRKSGIGTLWYTQQPAHVQASLRRQRQAQRRRQKLARRRQRKER